VIDLETLIRDKQDAPRGRPRDWIDDFKDWRGRVDGGVGLGCAVLLCAVCIILIIGG
jgi:hypothetical protein